MDGIREALGRALSLRQELSTLEEPIETLSRPWRLADPSIEQLLHVLSLFPTLAGYLNGRRPSGSSLAINCEADVQDVLFIALKPIFPEMVHEQPTQKGAAGFSIGDFGFPQLRLILEAKFISRREDVQAKANEVAEDIWKYTHQSDCESVVFFVYDPKRLIPDRVNFASSLSSSSGGYKASGREVQLLTVVQ